MDGTLSTEAKKLEVFEESLCCPICGDLFSNPFMLTCGHVYCSLCIRKHLDKSINLINSKTCPSCKESAYAEHLRPARTLASVVGQFKLLKPELIHLCSRPKQAGAAAPNSRSRSTKAAAAKSDNFLSGDTDIKRVVAMNFHGMTKDKVKKQLDAACSRSSSKLRLDGDKDTLEKRYREFVHLNNAQLLHPTPLTFAQVVDEVTRRENSKDSELKKSAKDVKKIENLKKGNVCWCDDLLCPSRRCFVGIVVLIVFVLMLF